MLSLSFRILWKRLLYMLLEFPPGMSVLPHSPMKRASPVSSFWLFTRRHMPSGVCPGVWMTFRGMVPMLRVSPSLTLMSGLILDRVWATIFAVEIERNSWLPAVWSEWSCVLMMYLSFRFSAFIMRVISPAL